MWLFLLSLLLLTSTGAVAQVSTDERSIRSWGPIFTGAAMIKPGVALPHMLANDLTTQLNIRSVACYVEGGGTVTINPVLHGKGPTSLLQRPLVCQDRAWTAGPLQGTPILRSFAKDGAKCPVEPCTIDIYLAAVTGQPTYLVIKIVGVVPRGSTRTKRK